MVKIKQQKNIEEEKDTKQQWKLPLKINLQNTKTQEI